MWKQGSGFICPNLEQGPIPGSRLFDPGRCDCLKYEGKQEISWDRPPAEWRTVSTCRADRDICLRDMNIPLKDHNLDWVQQQCYTDMPHVRSALWIGKKAAVSNKVILQFCPKHQNCMVLTYKSWFELGADRKGRLEHMNDKWYQNIDPATYDLTKDNDGLGIYWCKTKSCGNFHTYNQGWSKRLLKPSDFRHACPP